MLERINRRVVMFVLVGLASCTNPAEVDLQRARARFAGVGDSYAFTSEVGCNCPATYTDPIRIEVVNGSIASAVYAETSAPVPDEVSVENIEDIFARIESAIDDGADEITVSYDLQLGFPAVVRIDYSKSRQDEEYSIEVRDVEAL